MRQFSIVLLVLVGSILLVSAGVDLGVDEDEQPITTSYGENDILQGYLNISLDNEPISRRLSHNLEGHSPTLLFWLNATDADYDCSPSDCSIAYSASVPSTLKTFQLDQNGEKLIGFKIEGDVKYFTGVRMTIESTASSSCVSQLAIDILDDGTNDAANNKSTANTCGTTKTQGCFNASRSTSPFLIDQAYCQRMKLSASPGFRIGATIDKQSGERDIRMELLDGRGRNQASCVIESNQIPQGTREVFCDVDYLVTEPSDHYICIYPESTINGEQAPSGSTYAYWIEGYESSGADACGVAGIVRSSTAGGEDASFPLFATGKGYAAFGSLTLKDKLPDDRVLTDLFLRYLDDTYGDTDCNTHACVIPIRLRGAVGQTISFKDLDIRYTTTGTRTENRFYDVEESAALVDLDQTLLDVSVLNLSVGDDLGERNVRISLGDVLLVDQEIEVSERVGIRSISPTRALAGLPTTFSLRLDLPKDTSVSTIEWDFGNGDTKLTRIPNITYTYNATGVYDLTLRIVDSEDRTSTQTFVMPVGTPKDVANLTLLRRFDELAQLKESIAALPLDQRTQVEAAIGYTTIQQEVEEVQKLYLRAIDDDDYIEVMDRLLVLDFPVAVGASQQAKGVSLFPQAQYFDVTLLNEVTGDYGSGYTEEDYAQAWMAWYWDNVRATYDYSEIVALDYEGSEPLLTFVSVTVPALPEARSNVYLFVEDLADSDFGSTLVKEASGWQYLEVSRGTTLSFSTTEALDFSDLPIFIAPGSRDLELGVKIVPLCTDPNLSCGQGGKTWRTCPDACSNTHIIVWWTIGLLVFFFVLYIFMQEWYKRHYETYLFKSRNFLYNMLVFIHHQKMAGMSDSLIEHKLKKAGWTGEQVRYGMRKYYGKRTGMFEIPMDWFFGLFSKQKMPRHGRGMPPRRVRRYP